MGWAGITGRFRPEKINYGSSESNVCAPPSACPDIRVVLSQRNKNGEILGVEGRESRARGAETCN